ncbi:YwqJ-related putative deaminase [Tenggerimyces flavus]|uniref:YwqJ-related putative deaminase n=1 Tax=Tenggerimyces flavus TaxID=1708749 RepID=A0ABV7YAF0_9ACTN
MIGSQSNRRRGPVLSGAMDRQTGQVFFGQNTGIPRPLHPELGTALNNFRGPAAAGKGVPGAHAEIYAVSAGLLARQGSSISDFSLYSVRLRGTGQGSPIIMCPNCSSLLKGAEDLVR